MVLTNCAVCAAPPLAHNPPRCRECETTFCSVTCYNHYHGMNDSWRFYLWRADEKYKEAVAVAVEACADDTKGQTCYIWAPGHSWNCGRTARSASRALESPAAVYGQRDAFAAGAAAATAFLALAVNDGLGDAIDNVLAS